MSTTLYAELWRYRELMFFLAWRDVKVRYKQAALGVAWAALQPLANMVVFTLLFGKLAGISSEGIPYPLFAYSGLVLWTYASGIIGSAGMSLVSNSNLITKVYFPRVALPISVVVSGLLDFCIGLVLLVAMMGYYQVTPSWSLVMAPFFLACLILATLGISLLFSAVNVRFRDIKHVIPFLLQLWLFLTPVVYPLSLVPTPFQSLMALNPLTGIFEGFRASIFPDRPFDPVLTAISLTVALMLFVSGLIYFRNTERTFADFI